MTQPTAALLALRASTADLVQGLEGEGWGDDDVRVASLCAGWTRGHVLTHVARNADGIASTLAGALRDEIVDRYPDGFDARNAAIDAGARRPLPELIADITESAQRLDRVLGAVSDARGWDLPTEAGHQARDWVFWRVREIEVHRVDLAATYTPDWWPRLLISELMPAAAEALADRTDDSVHVEITPEGTIVAELAGSTWEVGSGTPTRVQGPDWAVLAWLVGRGQVARDHLTAAPPLRAWR